MFVGKAIERVDAREKVLGRGLFAGDLTMENMLFGVVLRSDRVHARLRSIDTRDALSTEGVVTILTHRDIPGRNGFGVLKKDQPYFAEDYVRFLGEPVLMVIGETERIAREAAEKIRIDWEEIKPILDPFEAANSSLSLAGREGGNLLCHKTVIKGDAKKGVEDADVIIERAYSTQRADHVFLECEAGIGYPDPSGRIVVVSSTQNIHYKMKEVAKLLALPEEKVRIIQAPTGGGFGGKLDVTVEGYAALGAFHTKKPVMVRYNREESMLANTKRHPLHMTFKTGAKKDGRLTLVEAKIVGDTGPYASYGEVVALRAAVHATGPYQVDNVWVESKMYFTNNPVCGAMRGFGIPQIAFAHESQMDLLAEALNMDPLEIRMINGLRKGSATATGQVLHHSVGFLETLKRVEPAWKSRKRNGKNGFGLGCMFYGIGNTGVPNPSGCHLTLTPEGRVAFHLGACDIGQGSDTVLTQILLETLGIEKEAVELVKGDSDTSEDAGSSSASRQTYITGRAVYEAATKLRSYLEEKGLKKGRSLKDIFREASSEGRIRFDGFFDPPTTPLDLKTGQGVPYATYAFATHLTEVEVEPSTYTCTVKKVHAAHDVGRAINPTATRGQIYGGIAMGIGLALMEEFIPSKSRSLYTYHIPGSMDMPSVVPYLVEDAEPTGPYGAKGVGEPALIPQTASILNAIKDATGIRGFELPCNFERLCLLSERKKR
jgi:CO/xanthine dehydrogenase Mo-binding subunit